MANLGNITKEQLESYLKNYFNIKELDIDNQKDVCKLIQSLNKEISVEVVFHKNTYPEYNLKVGFRTYTVKANYSNHPFALSLVRYLMDEPTSRGFANS